MKIISWCLIIIGFFFLGAVLVFGVDAISAEYEKIVASTNEAASTLYEQVTHQKETNRPYVVVLVGDMMIDRGVKSKVYANGNGDYAYLFEHVQSELQGADIAFGNLEGSMSTIGADTGKAYSFRFEPKAAQAFADTGFDVLAQANNHGLDWGRDSLCASIGHLENAGIFGLGAGCTIDRAEKPFIQELPDGTRVGFLAFTEFYKEGYAREDSPGLARYTEENMIKQIDMLEAQGIDIIFVSLHWGTEYHLRSNEAQQLLGHKLVDAGADVIVGHHPHVIQEIERYKEGWIVYSLGNFIFDQKFSTQTMKGLLARVLIKDGTVADIEPVIVQLNENYQPVIDPEQKYDYISGKQLEEAHIESHRLDGNL